MTYFDVDDSSGNICNKSCDICGSGNNLIPVDCSEDAINVLNCLDSMQKIYPKVTTKFLTLTFRGPKSSTVISKGFQNVSGYGKGKN